MEVPSYIPKGLTFHEAPVGKFDVRDHRKPRIWKEGKEFEHDRLSTQIQDARNANPILHSEVHRSEGFFLNEFSLKGLDLAFVMSKGTQEKQNAELGAIVLDREPHKDEIAECISDADMIIDENPLLNQTGCDVQVMHIQNALLTVFNAGSNDVIFALPRSGDTFESVTLTPRHDLSSLVEKQRTERAITIAGASRSVRARIINQAKPEKTKHECLEITHRETQNVREYHTRLLHATRGLGDKDAKTFGHSPIADKTQFTVEKEAFDEGKAVFVMGLGGSLMKNRIRSKDFENCLAHAKRNSEPVTAKKLAQWFYNTVAHVDSDHVKNIAICVGVLSEDIDANVLLAITRGRGEFGDKPGSIFMEHLNKRFPASLA
jgi:hypothetical protein